MKKAFGYYILILITWPMQFFPLGFHYLFADVLFFLFYRVAGYRKKVVNENLRNAFPEKTQTERDEIERKFYHHFIDMFIETLYFTHANQRKASKRLVFENLELIYDQYAKGKNVIFILGHLGNWEFFQLVREEVKSPKFFVYKKLGSKAFDQYYKLLRSRAAQPLEMGETYRKLFEACRKGEQFTAFFISDQRPLRTELFYWLTFLNQDTPVLTGTEKIARKMNASVIYLEFSEIKRGYQKARLELISDDVSNTAEHEITNLFFEKLEKSIRQYPHQYFWTHKRWKYKKN
jgi:Kdo2-lipid IVA lauroyltransferase/acyltransferase